MADRVFAAYARLPYHRGKHRILTLLSKYLVRRRVTAAAQGGLMCLDIADCVQAEILVNGAYEPLTFAALSRCVRPGDCVVDVGAHVGQFTLLASRLVGANGKVIAVEPNPETFQDLERNLRLNGCENVVPILAAVADSPRLAKFSHPPRSNRGTSREANSQSDSIYVVGAFPLCGIIDVAGVRQVNILKVDVEGAEANVLQSLFVRESLRPSAIIFEFLPNDFHYGRGPQELLAMVVEHGYALENVAGAPYVYGDDLPENNIVAVRRDLCGAKGDASRV